MHQDQIYQPCLLNVETAPGGQPINTADIENYAGFKSITGPELATNMYDGALQFGAEYQYGDIEKVIDHGDYKEVIAFRKFLLRQSRYYRNW